MRRVIIIAVVAALSLLSAQVSLAATITLGGSCFLNDAIKSANDDSVPSGSSCAKGSGADTISFGSVTNITLVASLTDITSDITFQGGTNVSIDAIDTYRHFNVTSAGKLTLKNIILNNGKSTTDGGSIYVASGGRLTLDKVTLGNSEADRNGGGIYVASGATATIQNGSRVHDNDAISGGGIYSAGSLTIINSTLESNDADTSGNNKGYGGGIYVTGGSTTVRGSKIQSNTSDHDGGGIYMINAGASTTIEHSTITSNTAGNYGGGIDVALTARLTITNSTIAENTAASAGGGISVAGSNNTLSHVSIVDNISNGSSNTIPSGLYIWTPGALSLRNSLIANTDDNADCGIDGTASLKQNVGNLIEDGNCSPAASGSPELDTSNSPLYYTINANSPALGIGNAAVCAANPIDQRGYYRPPTGCDAGSAEFGAANFIDVNADANNSPDTVCTLDEAVKSANENVLTNAPGCKAGASASDVLDIIRLTRNISLTSSTASATTRMLVEGNGRTVSVASGSTNVRLFHVSPISSGAGGDLTLRNITLSGGNEGQGPAVYSRGKLTMQDCVVKDNTSASYEGAVYLTQSVSDTTIDRCAFINNRSGSNGGAIYLGDGELTVSNSAFSGNHATNGGAIYISSGTATLAHLTLWNNTTNSAGNITGIRGGGTTNIWNSIIGRDTNQGGALCGGTLQGQNSTSERGIIITQTTTNCPQATVADPLLGNLAGFPDYYPLGAGSPARKAGIDAECAKYPTDQRGAARPATKCDIGAVQYYDRGGSGSAGSERGEIHLGRSR